MRTFCQGFPASWLAKGSLLITADFAVIKVRTAGVCPRSLRPVNTSGTEHLHAVLSPHVRPSTAATGGLHRSLWVGALDSDTSTAL